MSDHGWSELRGVTSISFDGTTVIPGRVSVAPVPEEHRRCGCELAHCHREATQEDLLCDPCRAICEPRV